MDKYDVALWRPCTYEQFVTKLCVTTLTVGQPSTLQNLIEQLHDTRIRTVFMAEVAADKETGRGSVEAPYLMTIYCPETGKTLCFCTSDELALG